MPDIVRLHVDPEGSRVTIEGSSSVHPIGGEANGVEGTIEAAVDGSRLDLATPPRARIEFPIDRIRSGNPLYDREMRRRVNARDHPTITGVLCQVEPPGDDGRYRVQGDLTFHGRTRRIDADVAVEVRDRQWLVADWEQVVDVRDFGVDPPRILMLRVHPEVRVAVHVEAGAEPQPTGAP